MATVNKAFMSGLTISLAEFPLMSTVGNLHTLKDSEANKADKLNLICPECDDPTQVKQSYNCEDGHGPFTSGQCDHGKKVGDKMVRITDAEIADAKGSEFPEKTLMLNIHAAGDVLPQTYPAGTAYVFTPTTIKPDLYSVILNLMEQRDDVVFMGVMNIRNADKLVFLSRGLNGQLIVQELVWPKDLKDFGEPFVPEIENKQYLMAEMVVDQNITEFTPDTYVKKSRERIEEIAQAKASGEIPTPKKGSTAKEQTDDLTAILEAALAGKKAS